jgi:hypothetical protein
MKELEAEPFYTTKEHARIAVLKLRFKTGNTHSFCYAYLLDQDHDITGSIELQFSNAKVIIEGQYLHRLADALDEQKVTSIREADSDIDRPGLKTLFVRSIRFTRLE